MVDMRRRRAGVAWVVLIAGVAVAAYPVMAQPQNAVAAGGQVVVSMPSDRAPIVVAAPPVAQLLAGKPALRSASPSAELVRWTNLDATPLLAEDAQLDTVPGVPQRVAVVRPVEGPLISSATNGAWNTLEDNSELWVMRLDVPGALEVRVHLSALKLAPGTQLVVAGEGPEPPVAYRGSGPQGTGQVWTAGVTGSVVYIEYQDPTGAAPDPVIEIDEILHTYREPLLAGQQAAGGQRGLAPCQEDVNCHTVDQTARDSVGRMFFVQGASGFVCTGALLNDADLNTFAGYFLTANHCISTQTVVDTLQIRWFYETDMCGGTASWLTTTTGGTLLATSPNSDFTLLRMANDPSAGQGFAAWTTVAPASNGATVKGIHHPGGSWKRYSEGPTTTSSPICAGLPLANFIYNDWTIGFTEGGSSGSPLFNSNWEVIGQLFGACLFATPACNNPSQYNNVYGRFSVTFNSIGLFLNSITPDDAFEDNDTSAQAPLINAGTYGLRLVDFDDYFKVNVGCQPNTITVTTTHNPSEMDLDLRLLDSSLNVVGQALGINATKTVSVAVGPGDYFVRLTKAANWGGDYTLDISLQINDDCNSNGVQDNCDVVGGTSGDLNANGIPDECEDCNNNQVPDDQDIAGGTSTDCNGNSFPDDCEPDCNGSGAPDDCDVAAGTSLDCDGNLVPDECDPDCNMNGSPDACDITGSTSTDLNTNGLPDDCEDCNANTIPDELDLAAGTSFDCNADGVLDECDVAAGTSTDCDGNIVPDECEPDCNSNGVTDACDIAGGTSTDCLGAGIPDECRPDCNGNGTPDDCDITFGVSTDCNTNQAPDECEPTLLGYGLMFDGVDDYVDVGSGFNYAANFTIEAWVRTSDINVKQMIFGKREASPLSGYVFFQENGKLVFTALGVMRYETAGVVLANDTWTHVAATMAADLTVRFYVNGALTDTVAGVNPITSGLGKVFVGSLAPDTGSTWLGELDEVRVWNVARSAAQIVANRDAQINGTPANLAGYWRFNTGSGLVAVDQVGGADGTLVNGPQWINQFADCNSNGAMDVCDIALGGSADINGDGVPDECNADCNSNGLPDADDIAAGTSADCNTNAIPDECDVAATSPDCNANTIPDECETDCDQNGVADDCDVAAGTATDCDSNGVLDSCETGRIGFALQYDGITDYVDGGNQFNSFTNGFTIEAWVRLDSIVAKQVIISKRKSSPVDGFALFQQNGKVTFTVLGVQSYTTANAVLTPGTWTHIAVVMDAGNDVHFYINGVFEETVTGASPVVANNGRVFLGRLAPDAADYLAGGIDDVRVWSIERPAAAIAATMFTRLTGSEDGLAAYWRFDEGTGVTAGDDSPTGAAATVVGPAWVGGHPFDTDCNTNGVYDACEIGGGETDCNADAVLDSCESVAGGDYNADGVVNGDDLAGLTACLAGPAAAPAAPCTTMCLAAFDTDGDGNIDLRDFTVLQQSMSAP